MKKFGNSEFSTKPTNYYNLEMIIAIGFRVKSSQGTKFRIWANEKLKDNIGLTNFSGDMPTKKETEIAKNYLTHEELQVLNRLVSAYLDVAEINALKRQTMTMQDWVAELDSFLKMTHNDILNNKGTVSHSEALKKAHEEYDKYMQNHLTRAEKDYLEIMNIEIKEINSNN